MSESEKPPERLIVTHNIPVFDRLLDMVCGEVLRRIEVKLDVLLLRNKDPEQMEKLSAETEAAATRLSDAVNKMPSHKRRKPNVP